MGRGVEGFLNPSQLQIRLFGGTPQGSGKTSNIENSDILLLATGWEGLQNERISPHEFRLKCKSWFTTRGGCGMLSSLKQNTGKMSEKHFQSTTLPPALRKKVRALAVKLGSTEEEAVAKMVHLVLNELDQPGGSDLRTFVEQARKARQTKAPKK